MRFGIEGETGFGDGGVSPLDMQDRAVSEGDPNWVNAGRTPESATADRESGLSTFDTLDGRGFPLSYVVVKPPLSD